MSFSAFEHKLLKILKADFGDSAKVWVSCSFGLDSLVLLNAIKNLVPVLKLDLNVVHIHHGDSNINELTDEYRRLALKKAQDYCKLNNINLLTYKSEKFLESESDCREFRFSCYEKLDGGNVILGHHKQDLVETLLLKLIRGVGKQGFSFGNKNFKKFNIYRPLLSFLKKEIEEEAALNNLNPVQDPSNESDAYLRNWLRNSWLKDLENHRPGSLKSLGESLVNLQDFSENEPGQESQEVYKGFVVSSEIPVSSWLIMNSKMKAELVAQIIYAKSHDNFTAGQIQEVIKQLDLLKNEHKFTLAGVLWIKDKKSIIFKNA